MDARFLDPEERSRRRDRAGWVYYMAYLVFLLAYGGLIFGLNRAFHGAVLRVLCGFAWLFLKTVQASATKVCQWMGVSLGGKSVETLARAASREVGVEQGAPILRQRSNAKFVLPALMTMMAWACFAEAPQCQCDSQPASAVPLAIAGLFGLLAAWGWKNLNQPALQVDTWGIRACDESGVFRRARWAQIRACDIVTERDTFGAVQGRWLVLKNRRGKQLMRLKAEQGVEDYIAIELLGHRRESSPLPVEPMV